MTFGAPQALLLLVPVALALWRFGLTRGVGGVLRAMAAVAVVVALARPEMTLGGGGRDVIVVADRSHSMPGGSDARALETVRGLEQTKGAADRVAVFGFGRAPKLEQAATSRNFGGFQREVDADGSDLGAALEAAADVAQAGRETRVLVLSDGLETGTGARSAARRLAARGIAVDFRALGRIGGEPDVAVASIDLPAEVRESEPFLFSATLRAAAAGPVKYRLRRGNTLLASGTANVPQGLSRLPFRDRVEKPGIAEYTLELEGTNDAVPENDRGRGVVRVEGRPRIVVVRIDGKTSALAKSLADSGLNVETTSAPPRSLEALDGVGAVVLENVPASALGEQGLEVLATYVRDAGGGLLMTGGRRSFGEGGYHKSALDEVLPVSMELREEQRKASIALGISMDRSGSMTMTTPEGVTKMHLAAEGAVAALQLLTKGDEAAVWVVDTRAHDVFPLTGVEDGLSLDLVASVQSEGGGIFIGEALDAAAEEMLKSRKATRHIILFADAADSEEPGDYREVLAKLRAANVTVSVIGMGTEHDPDAKLLKDVAELGGGRIYFADNAKELPRLFSEETIVIARSSFVDGKTPLASTPDLALLGVGSGTLPELGGYNRVYPRAQAAVALRTADDEAAPVLAFWPVGLGRAAAFAGEADGEYSGGLKGWDGYKSLFVRTVRHLLPSSEAPDALVRARVEGHELHVTVELDDTAGDPGEAKAVVLASDASQPARTQPLRWEDAHHLGARFPLEGAASLFPVVKLGGRVLRAAPVALPYPPEYEPRPAGEGRALLSEIALVTGGAERLSLEGIWTAGGSAPGRRPLAAPIVALALALVVAEVVIRRARLFATALRKRTPAVAPKAAPSVPAIAQVPVIAQEKNTGGEAGPPPPPPPAAPKPDSVLSALERARERARKRVP